MARTAEQFCFVTTLKRPSGGNKRENGADAESQRLPCSKTIVRMPASPNLKAVTAPPNPEPIIRAGTSPSVSMGWEGGEMIFRGSHPESVKLLLMASPAAKLRSINCLRVKYPFPKPSFGTFSMLCRFPVSMKIDLTIH